MSTAAILGWDLTSALNAVSTQCTSVPSPPSQLSVHIQKGAGHRHEGNM